MKGSRLSSYIIVLNFCWNCVDCLARWVYLLGLRTKAQICCFRTNLSSSFPNTSIFVKSGNFDFHFQNSERFLFFCNIEVRKM